MEKLILFIAEQWLLVAALLSCILFLSFHESRRSGRGVSPQQLVNLINQEQVLVLDLRDKAEFSKGHIVDSVHVPFAKLDEEIDRHASSKEQPVVLVCKMGQHASPAGKKLASKGYTQVYRLKGGIGEWQAMQMPLVKG